MKKQTKIKAVPAVMALRSLVTKAPLGALGPIAKRIGSTPEAVRKWKYQGIPKRFWIVLSKEYKIPLDKILVLDKTLRDAAANER